MLKHKFAAGAVVVIRPDPRLTDLRPGLYKILQALPSTDSGLQYRVQNAADPHDRVIDEARLSAADRW
jgi:hypothetical protein